VFLDNHPNYPRSAKYYYSIIIIFLLRANKNKSSFFVSLLRQRFHPSIAMTTDRLHQVYEPPADLDRSATRDGACDIRSLGSFVLYHGGPAFVRSPAGSSSTSSFPSRSTTLLPLRLSRCAGETTNDKHALGRGLGVRPVISSNSMPKTACADTTPCHQHQIYFGPDHLPAPSKAELPIFLTTTYYKTKDYPTIRTPSEWFFGASSAAREYFLF